MIIVDEPLKSLAGFSYPKIGNLTSINYDKKLQEVRIIGYPFTNKIKGHAWSIIKENTNRRDGKGKIHSIQAH